MSTSLTGSAGGSKIPKGYSAGSLQQFSPEQMDLFKRLFSQVAPGSSLYGQAQGDQAAFAPYEEQAQRDFQEFGGQLGSRFSEYQPGAMSSRRGSGFKNVATQGAQDFASQLSMQRQELQRQALMDLMGISNMLLRQEPNKNFLIPEQQKQSKLAKWLGIGLPAAGAVAGGIFGGPGGAALGGQLGTTLASGFNGGSAGNYQGISGLPNSWQALRG